MPSNATPTPEQTLDKLGLTLPSPPAPVASYVPVCRVDRLVFVSGQLPFIEGGLHRRGLVGGDVSVEDAQTCARLCALNGLAVLRGEIGALSKVERVVRVGCFVASGEAFKEHPKVANGASDLLAEVFGERGRHARAAVGCSSLPLGAPVEIEFIFAVS